jgi:hypothetical protein
VRCWSRRLLGMWSRSAHDDRFCGRCELAGCKKLAEASNGKDYIETVRGHGYALREPQEGKVKISASSIFSSSLPVPEDSGGGTRGGGLKGL